MMSKASPESTDSNADRNSPGAAGPRSPEDRRIAVSLVLWSESTEILLRLLSTHHARCPRSSSRATATSVSRKHRSVAMLGSIIPAPFAVPTMRPFPTAADLTLGKASVVMMARATGRIESAWSDAASAGSPWRISWTGSSQPMMPVEAANFVGAK